jgi:hypothetical protein
LLYEFLVQMTYKRCHSGGVDINNAPAFAPVHPGFCQLGDVPIDSEIPKVTSLLLIDPGKLNILTLSTGPKLMGPDGARLQCSITWHAHTWPCESVTPGQAKKLNDAKAAEEARKAHHFRVLTCEQLWEAARAAQATAKALTLQYMQGQSP